MPKGSDLDKLPFAPTPSRRRMIGTGLLAIAGLAGVRTYAHGELAVSGETMSILDTKAIHHVAQIHAEPKRIYDALLDSNQFTAFSTGRVAEIQPTVGGTFSVFGGHIYGRNLELAPAQRIVQAWRVENWPAGVYSIAKFELSAHEGGTQIVFDHTGFPSEEAQHLSDGWQEHYWDALNKFFAVTR